MPTKPVSAVIFGEIRWLALTMMVRGPGQNKSVSILKSVAVLSFMSVMVSACS